MGGGGGNIPAFEIPDIGKNLANMGGKELEAYAKNAMLNGLDPKVKAMIEGSAAGSLRSGQQDLREQFASMGNAPIGAQVGATTNLRSDISKNLQQNLLSGDMAARQQGFQDWTGLGQMAMGISGAQNQYNLGGYQANEQSRAGKASGAGNLAGSALTAGATVAAAL